MLADSVGPALLVVLDKLEPAGRLAFVLHDLSGVPSTRTRRSSASRRSIASSKATASSTWPSDACAAT
jgi:hypothetical protein